MAYAVYADALAQFGPRELIALSDRDMTGAADQVLIDAALERASAEIDSYLAGRYALPLAVVPSVLPTFCCDIMRYRLTGAHCVCTEEIRDRFTDARRWLERVAAGQVGLGVDSATGGAPDTADNIVAFFAQPTVFGRGGAL